jgi:class 3 adenylate cyclase
MCDYLVIAFAGDAIICVFDDAGNDATTSAVVKALLCAKALIGVANLFTMSKHPLRSHIGLTYGDMSFATLGGVGSHWVFLLNGPCVSELHDCVDDAALDEIVISPSLYEELRVKYPEGGGQSLLVERTVHLNYRVLQFDETFNMVHPDQRLNNVMASLDVTRMYDLNEKIFKFVPPPALYLIQNNTFGMPSELCRVTTMFLDLSSYSPDRHKDPLSLAPFFEVVQLCLMETRGFLRQFLIDDKGCVVIAMWGLGSFTYENNAARAVMCAALISQRCAEIKHRCSIGITTGDVYVGNIGSSFRRDYVGIGSDVNLAARFMCKAKDKIFIDESTYLRVPTVAQHQIMAGELLELKGMPKKVPSYVYASMFVPQLVIHGNSDDVLEFKLPIEIELMLKKQLNDFLSADKSNSHWDIVREYVKSNVSITVLEGAEGTSRDLAVEFFHSLAKDEVGLTIYRVKAHEKDKETAHGILKSLVLKILEASNFNTEFSQRNFLERMVREELNDDNMGNIKGAVNFLKDFLGLSWTDENTRYHGYQSYLERREAVVMGSLKVGDHDVLIDDCLIVLLVTLLKTHRCIIIIEDGHYLDDTSMSILERFQLEHLRTFIIMSMYTDVDRSEMKQRQRLSNYVEKLFSVSAPVFINDPYVSITLNPGFKSITLPTLAADECKSILDNVLAERRPSMNSHNMTQDDLTEKVHHIAEGNPYWCSVIATFIRDYGVWEFEKAFEESQSILVDKDGSRSVLDPFVIARLKGMTSDAQIVIKWASVLGKEFNQEDLGGVLPSAALNIWTILETFVNHSFIKCVSDSPIVYTFVNSSVRKAIYKTITPA